MTAHAHDVFVPGCYRCDLSRDEVKHPVRPWVTCSGNPCVCVKPKSPAPDPSPYEQSEIDRFGIFEEEQGR